MNMNNNPENHRILYIVTFLCTGISLSTSGIYVFDYHSNGIIPSYPMNYLFFTVSAMVLLLLFVVNLQIKANITVRR